MSLYIAAAIILFIIFKIAVIVPEKKVYIVERLGKYKKKFEAGLHFMIPIFDRIAYKHTLKEEAIDVAPQHCITADNVQVQVDGILYLRIVDPVSASYGIDNYKYAVSQLAQTTMRSEIGKIELDKTFCGRESLNENIVNALDQASADWGIKVNRYEIRDITPGATILNAMESQMRAEREKRAEILFSEGKKQSRINISLGQKQKAINEAMGEKEKRIKIAEGRSRAIQLNGEAAAKGIKMVAEALNLPYGINAKNLRLAESYIRSFEQIVKSKNVAVYPETAAAVASFSEIIKKAGKENL